jgi:protein tyrosine phosphatase
MEEKCQQYWSDTYGEQFEGYEVNVTLTSVTKQPDFTIREFSVIHQVTNQERMITQLHYTSWPDFDVPRDNPIGILKFIRKCRAVRERNQPAPVLVHCSAGCGRTGTFIALDAMLQMLQKEKRIDIAQFIYQ